MERMTARMDVDADDLLDAHAVVELPSARRDRIIAGCALIVVGLLTGLLFGLGAKSGVPASFKVNAPTDYFTIPTISVPARPFAFVIGAIIIVLGVVELVRGFSRRAMRWVTAVALVGLVIAFLAWATTGQKITLDMLSVLEQTLILSVPLILGSMAGILGERSGVVNVAIEGQLLAGAFAGALVGTLAKNDAVGIAGAIVAGGLIGALLAVFAIKYLVNQVVLGVVLNLLVLGLTGFLYDALMAPQADTYNSPPTLNNIQIPVLGRIPVVGQVLFDQNIIIYMMYVIVIVINVWLFKTRWGLRTRAVGEHPQAAETVGVKVRRTRYRNVILGGLVAGLGGAYFTIGTNVTFAKDMTSGLGFIALAALIVGRWKPLGALGAALLFGFASSLANVLSFIQPPVQINSAFVAMLPYAVTIFAVAGFVGRVRAPAADGIPYTGR
jgi:general nucleoside transport system permease protein